MLDAAEVANAGTEDLQRVGAETLTERFKLCYREIVVVQSRQKTMTRGPSKQFDTELALSRATDVFWARGYEAASLSELLENMGIGKKSLYDTFGNKQALFLKALAAYAQATVRTARDRLAAEGSPLANLKALLRDWQETNARPGSYGCLLGNSIADFSTDDADIARLLRGYLQQIEDAFCETLARARATGEISTHTDPRAFARLLVCTTQGIALLGRVMEDDRTLSGAVDAVLTALEAGS